MEAEKKLANAGVFKGADGLRKLVNAGNCWSVSMVDDGEPVVECVKNLMGRMVEMVRALNRDRSYGLAHKTQSVIVFLNDYVDVLDEYGYEETTFEEFSLFGEDELEVADEENR